MDVPLSRDPTFDVATGHYKFLNMRTAGRDPVLDRRLLPASWAAECQDQAAPMWNLKTPSMVNYGIASSSLQGCIRQARVDEAIQWCMEMVETDADLTSATKYIGTANLAAGPQLILRKIGKGETNFLTRAMIISVEDIALANPCMVSIAAKMLNVSYNSFDEAEQAYINFTILLARSMKSRATDWACICRITVPEDSYQFDIIIYYNKLVEALMNGNHVLAIGYIERIIVESLHDKTNKVKDPLSKIMFEELSKGITCRGVKIKHYKNKRQMIWLAFLKVTDSFKVQEPPNSAIRLKYPVVMEIVESCYDLAHDDKFRWGVPARLFGRMAAMAICLRDDVEVRGFDFRATPVEEMPGRKEFDQDAIKAVQLRHRNEGLRYGISDICKDKHNKEGASLGRSLQHFIELKAFLRHEDMTLAPLSDFYLKLCLQTRYNERPMFDNSRLSPIEYAEWIPQLRNKFNRMNMIEDIIIKQTITITFGDRGENAKGMEMIGQAATEGFTITEMVQFRDNLMAMGMQCELVDLNQALVGVMDSDGKPIIGEPAALLIIRNALSKFVSIPNNSDLNPTDALLLEMVHLDWDKKKLNKGKVSNAIARHNLCFADFDQEPDYDAGKGRIYSWKNVPLLSSVRDKFGQCFGPKAANLIGEGNHYYDVTKCYIGQHGDVERRIVIAIRLGASMSLEYQWYKNSTPRGQKMKFMLNHSDMYIMSSKSVGFDWHKKVVATLRHSANEDAK